jgi:hypothetical protein
MLDRQIPAGFKIRGVALVVEDLEEQEGDERLNNLIEMTMQII